MRTVFHERLSELACQVGQMCGRAGLAMQQATQALLEADIRVAEPVLTDHEQLMALRAKAEKEALALLALQQPVAGELRDIFASMQIIADAERMDALAVHVAKIARWRYPQHALPAEVRECFAEMGRWQSRWVIAQKRSWYRAIRKKLLVFARQTPQWTACTGSCLPC